MSCSMYVCEYSCVHTNIATFKFYEYNSIAAHGHVKQLRQSCDEATGSQSERGAIIPNVVCHHPKAAFTVYTHQGVEHAFI